VDYVAKRESPSMSRTVVPPATVGHEPPVWGPLVRVLQDQLYPRQASELLAAIELLESEPNTLRLRVPQQHLGPWLREGLLLRLEALVASLSGGHCALALIPADDTTDGAGDPTQTFDRFVTGPSNETCVGAARSLVALACSSPQPLLLWGPKDSGKTHLLRALARALDGQSLGGPVLFRSADVLSLEIVRAIWSGRLSELRSELSQAGALIVDDLQTLGDREATRQELILLLEVLQSRGSPVVLSTNCPPDQLQHLGKNMDTVLRSARVARLSQPEWETRVAVFLDRALSWGIDLRGDVASTLATGIGDELWRVDPVLTRCMLLRRTESEGVDLEHTRRALAPGPLYAERPAPELVLDVVARHYGLRVRDLKGTDRTEPLRTARCLAAYLLRVRCGLSFPQIGRQLDRHHTTMLHAVRQAETRFGVEASLTGQLTLLEKEIISRGEKGE
jgi:chromosomal replication initiator protein